MVTGMGMGPGHNVHIAQGLGLVTEAGNIMYTPETHYKVPPGNISGAEKWVGNPHLVLVQCEH